MLVLVGFEMLIVESLNLLFLGIIMFVCLMGWIYN